MPRFLILPLEKKDTFAKFSRSEMMAIVQRYSQWTRSLAMQKVLVDGDRLVEKKLLKTASGRLKAQEPGRKEAMPGGFWLIQAKNMKHALKLCGDCPHFEFGALQVLRVEGNREA